MDHEPHGTGGEHRRAAHPAHLFQDTWRVMEDVVSGAEYGTAYPTGIERIDALISGGLQPGTLTLVAAEPNVGKTALLVHLAGNLTTTNSSVVVLVFSLDDTPHTFMARLLAACADVPITAVTNRAGRDPEVADRILRASENLRHRSIIVRGGNHRVGDGDACGTMAGLKEEVTRVYRALIHGHSDAPPQLAVLIDSHRNISPPGGRALLDANARTETIGRELKALTELRVDDRVVHPIIVATEHLRKGVGLNASMEDIKDSCGPSYNASLVLILGNSCQAGRNRRDEKLSLERTDGGDDLVLEVRVDKNKLGSMLYEPGRFHGALMAFDNRTGRMREITDAHDFAAIGKVIQARR